MFGKRVVYTVTYLLKEWRWIKRGSLETNLEQHPSLQRFQDFINANAIIYIPKMYDKYILNHCAFCIMTGWSMNNESEGVDSSLLRYNGLYNCIELQKFRRCLFPTSSVSKVFPQKDILRLKYGGRKLNVGYSTRRHILEGLKRLQRRCHSFKSDKTEESWYQCNCMHYLVESLPFPMT
jgi:hypothetical protein